MQIEKQIKETNLKLEIRERIFFFSFTETHSDIYFFLKKERTAAGEEEAIA